MPLLPKVLVLCTDAEARIALDQSLERCAVERVYCASVAALRQAVAERAGDAVVYAEDYPGGDLRALMEWPELRDARLPVIAVARAGGIRDYLQAMLAGAFDYLARPLCGEEVRRIVESAVRRTRAHAA